MNPMWLRRSTVNSRSLIPVITVELTATWPESTVSRPARQCISVDLPDHNGGEVAGPKRHRNLIECCDFRIGGAECFGYALGCYGSRLRINRHVSRVPADNPGNIRKRYDLLGKNLVLQDEIDQDEIDDDD